MIEWNEIIDYVEKDLLKEIIYTVTKIRYLSLLKRDTKEDIPNNLFILTVIQLYLIYAIYNNKYQLENLIVCYRLVYSTFEDSYTNDFYLYNNLLTYGIGKLRKEWFELEIEILKFFSFNLMDQQLSLNYLRNVDKYIPLLEKIDIDVMIRDIDEVIEKEILTDEENVKHEPINIILSILYYLIPDKIDITQIYLLEN
jgi:hypothetical protein